MPKIHEKVNQYIYKDDIKKEEKLWHEFATDHVLTVKCDSFGGHVICRMMGKRHGH